MADILTQLQTCLDQLSTQFYASLRYINTYHDTSPATQPPNERKPPLPKMPKNPSSNPSGHSENNPNQPSEQDLATTNNPDDPHPQQIFTSNLRELARDLVIKEQQIEHLIAMLPGIDSSEVEQEGRIRALEAELRRVEEEKTMRRRELRELGRRVRAVLGAVGERG